MTARKPLNPDNYRKFKEIYLKEFADEVDGPMGQGSYPYLSSPEVMTIGCSITSGHGLPFGWAWPEIIKTCLGIRLNNCASSGQGVLFLTYLAMEIIHKWGIPKTIFMFLPDFERTLVPVFDESRSCYQSEDAQFLYAEKSYKIDKLPVKINSDVSEFCQPNREISIQNSILALRHFERFCAVSGIDLYLSSWVGDVLDFIEKVDAKNIITAHQVRASHDTNLDYISDWYGVRGTVGCRHSPANERQEELWNIASDDVHPGLHAQIHLAEHFTQKVFTPEHIKLIT